MLMELLFGSFAGILTVCVIGFTICIGIWFAWIFLKKSAEPAAADATPAAPASDPQSTSADT